MTRDEEFLKQARAYLDAQEDVEQAERHRQQAADHQRTAQAKLEAARAQLAEFVGSNVRTKNALIDNTLIRVEFQDQGLDEAVRVTVEPVARAH